MYVFYCLTINCLTMGNIICYINCSCINDFLFDKKFPNPKHSIWNWCIFEVACILLSFSSINFLLNSNGFEEINFWMY